MVAVLILLEEFDTFFVGTRFKKEKKDFHSKSYFLLSVDVCAYICICNSAWLQFFEFKFKNDACRTKTLKNNNVWNWPFFVCIPNSNFSSSFLSLFRFIKNAKILRAAHYSLSKESFTTAEPTDLQSSLTSIYMRMWPSHIAGCQS